MTDTAYSDKTVVLIVSTLTVFLVPFGKVGDITAFLFFKALWLGGVFASLARGSLHSNDWEVSLLLMNVDAGEGT
jgi:hypothetical protein